MYMCADGYETRCGIYFCCLCWSTISVPERSLLLLEPPLRVPSTVNPVSLIEGHLWRTKQGIVDRFNSQHELFC
jgi:hypothetical protein